MTRHISKLQKAQNLLASVVTGSPQSWSSRTLLQQLPIKHRIHFKIANITFHIYSSFFQTGLPAFILSCLSFHLFLRSSASPTLISSLFRLSAHHLALAASALQPLKSGTISLYLRTCTSPDTFGRHLKTHICQQAFQST